MIYKNHQVNEVIEEYLQSLSSQARSELREELKYNPTFNGEFREAICDMSTLAACVLFDNKKAKTALSDVIKNFFDRTYSHPLIATMELTYIKHYENELPSDICKYYKDELNYVVINVDEKISYLKEIMGRRGLREKLNQLQEHEIKQAVKI